MTFLLFKLCLKECSEARVKARRKKGDARIEILTLDLLTFRSIALLQLRFATP